MAYGMRVVDSTLGINFDVKRENMAGKKEFELPVGYAPNGKVVSRKALDLNTNQPIQTTYKYVDEDGNAFEKSEITWKIGDDVVSPLDMTTVFEIKAYRPLSEYNDRFVMEKFYEFAPSDGASSKGKKKVSDTERDQTRISNLVGMHKLWEKLIADQVVAGGEFIGSSGNFKAGSAFIRAIKVNGTKWGLELGVAKELKIFEHLQEHVPQAYQQQQKKKLCSNLLD